MPDQSVIRENYIPRRRGRKPKPKVNKTKKMVTGHGPTLLERLAAQSDNIGMVAKSILPIALAINTEAKYFDASSSVTFYNPGTNDSLVNLTQGIAQGLTDVTRIGDSILAKNIAIKMNLLWLASNAVHQSHTRVIILVWKQNLQDNPPTIAKIFTTPATFLSGFNKDYTDQMVILKDKILPNQAQVDAATNQAPKYIKIFKKLDYHMRFDAGGIADGTVNHIYMVLRNSSATSANQGACDYWSRLNYTDN